MQKFEAEQKIKLVEIESNEKLKKAELHMLQQNMQLSVKKKILL